ncbi:unnamed protein product, partial [Mesorhabditis belari]|uniref:Integrin alpha-2 domain-containing protein n=1 Tax=Mesorhabditis belari TaxID=2138241 RepID=A0AAF3EBD8_9BILA
MRRRRPLCRGRPPSMSGIGLSFCSLFALILPLISAFNLDDSAPIYKFGIPGTYFGYSVAEHFRGNQPVVLIGAPKDENGQKETNKTGAVYACPLNTRYQGEDNSWCEKLFIEYASKDNYDLRPDFAARIGPDPVDYLGKDGQQLGAALASEGRPGGGAVVCAPLTRYRNASARLQGACYTLNDRLEYTNTLVTCETKNLDKPGRHNTYGACMQGLSAHLDKEMLITGVLGARMWTGGVYVRTNVENAFETIIEKYTMSQGTTIESSAEESIRPHLLSHDYLGFSVSAGRFGFWYEKGQKLTIVSGATRHNQTGAVHFLPFNKENKNDHHLALNDEKFSLEGKSFGSGFGYSVAVVDLDGNKFDDLIVGSPFEHRNDKDGQFGGVVYVYFSSGVERAKGESKFVFEKPIILKHAGYFSQFGLAITRLGNIHGNRKPTSDFAVGAPFAYEGAGAVYIYHGHTERANFRRKPAQIIIGSTLPSIAQARAVRSFGFSLSGGSDLDGNGYPDLVVGAYNSSLVTILRARPVISVGTTHSTVKPYIDIDGKSRCPSGQATCFDLKLTLMVEGNGARKQLVDYKSDVFICNLEVLPMAKGVPLRAHVRGANNPQNYTWPCGKNAHLSTQEYFQQIDIPNNAASQDWVNPLKFRFTVRIKNEKKPILPKQGAPLVDLNDYPILNKFGSTYDFTIPFNTRCGDDHVCQTDLALRATFAGIPNTEDGYVSNVGEKEHLDIQFEVDNNGEKAYQAHLNLTFDPEELELPSLQGKNVRGLILETLGKNSLLVQLGNPMDGRSKLTFDVRFKLVRGRTEGIGRPLRFKAHVNSTSDETNPLDNTWEAQVRLIKKAELELIGTSDPGIVRFGGAVKGVSAMQMEEDIGVMLRHNYTLHNKGPWTVRNVYAKFEWPYQVASRFRRGKYALYLLDVPTVVTYNVQTGVTDVKRCSVERPVEHINPEEIPLNTRHSVQITLPSARGALKVKRSAEPQNEPEQQPASAGFFFDRISSEKRKEGDVEVNVVSISCEKGSAKCFRVSCHFDFIDAGSAPVIDFRARLWNATFIEDYSDVEYVELLSHGWIELDESQGIADDPTNNRAQVATLAYPDRPALDDTRSVPWWIIVLAVLVGLLILAVIVLICWRCGFFKRNRVNQPSLYQAQLRHEREQWSEM